MNNSQRRIQILNDVFQQLGDLLPEPKVDDIPAKNHTAFRLPANPYRIAALELRTSPNEQFFRILFDHKKAPETMVNSLSSLPGALKSSRIYFDYSWSTEADVANIVAALKELLLDEQVQDESHLYPVMGQTLFDRVYDPAQIVNRYLVAFKERDQYMLDYARTLMAADAHDSTIAINSPSATRTYREHIVPCIFIHKEIVKRIQEGIKEAKKMELPSLVPHSVVQDLEKLVADNLKIAYIATADANRLDSTLRLRTTMPAGWNWGDSPTARLDVNNIPY